MCHEAPKTMKEGTIDEMERQEAMQETRQRNGKCHAAFVVKLVASGEGGAKMLHQVAKPT